MSGQVEVLKQRLGELSDLGSIAALASWDQQTKMPPRGGEARAGALATIAGLSHDMFIAAETGRLLEASAAELDGADPDSDDARLVALTQRQWEKARRVPSELASEQARAASIGQEAWVVARTEGDFAAFAPHLERNLELARQYIDCHLGHEGFGCGYDVLLDDYEPQMPTAEVVRLFRELKAELVPMLSQIAGAPQVDDGPLYASFAQDGQRHLVREVVGWMGFNDDGWRLDDTVHPFAIRIAPGDVRITTRFDRSYWPTGLYGAMHECGHGLYEDGIAPELAGTPLGSADSLALHESQSRMWENMVGRSRQFCAVLAPRIADLGGGSLRGLDQEGLFRAVNVVRPSLIRIEADEATYALHIIIRFELEQELIEGTLRVADLPEAWNARYAEYLGVQVGSDADGVMQDVHWSAGMIGYFPTYALGNLIAGQLWERAHADLDDLDGQLERGELTQLREWLRRHVHRYGGKYPTTELLEREGGGPITVAPFVRYLKAKLTEVYGLDFGHASDTHESEGANT